MYTRLPIFLTAGASQTCKFCRTARTLVQRCSRTSLPILNYKMYNLTSSAVIYFEYASGSDLFDKIKVLMNKWLSSMHDQMDDKNSLGAELKEWILNNRFLAREPTFFRYSGKLFCVNIEVGSYAWRHANAAWSEKDRTGAFQPITVSVAARQ